MRCSSLLHSHLIYICADFFCIFIAAAILFLRSVSLPASGLLLCYVASKFSWSPYFCKLWLSWTVISTLSVTSMLNLSSCLFSALDFHQLSRYLTLESYPSRIICVQSSFSVSSILLNTNIALTHHHCLAFFCFNLWKVDFLKFSECLIFQTFSQCQPQPIVWLVHDSVFSSSYNTSPTSIIHPANSLIKDWPFPIKDNFSTNIWGLGHGATFFIVFCTDQGL